MWRNARSLLTLRAEYDRAHPGRDRASDGGIADAVHASRSSDHNPWVKDSRGIGVVRAFDFDAGVGLDPNESHDAPGDQLLSAVLRAARAGHPAMRAGAYVIYEGYIYSYSHGWRRQTYPGRDRHESHVHLSVGRAQSAYDSTVAWGVAPSTSPEDATAAAVESARVLPRVDPARIRPGAKNADVALVQQALNRVMGRHLATDGDYGENTRAVALAFQMRTYGPGRGVDGDLGPESLRKLAEATGLFRVA